MFVKTRAVVTIMFLVSCVAQGQTTESGKAAQSADAHQCGDWSAWSDRMPGHKPTLHVKGTCTFPTGGYKTILRRAQPQGINQHILILDLKIVKPTGIVTQQITTQEAQFSEQTNAMYTDVQIRPDNVTVPVKVTQ